MGQPGFGVFGMELYGKAVGVAFDQIPEDEAFPADSEGIADSGETDGLRAEVRGRKEDGWIERHIPTRWEPYASKGIPGSAERYGRTAGT